MKDGRTVDNDKKLNGHVSDHVIKWSRILRVTKFGTNLTRKIWVIIMIIIWKKDALFLADVFEKFTGTCLKFYKPDHCHYFNSLGLSWDAMLKMTDV